MANLNSLAQLIISIILYSLIHYLRQKFPWYQFIPVLTKSRNGKLNTLQQSTRKNSMRTGRHGKQYMDTDKNKGFGLSLSIRHKAPGYLCLIRPERCPDLEGCLPNMQWPGYMTYSIKSEELPFLLLAPDGLTVVLVFLRCMLFKEPKAGQRFLLDKCSIIICSAWFWFSEAMVELFTKFNNAVMPFIGSPLCRLMFCLKSKVAQSFVGKWFLLEGCGKLKEHSGSCFMMCILSW